MSTTREIIGGQSAQSMMSLSKKLRHSHHTRQREAHDIAKARGSIASGRVVDETEVDAWIDSIGEDHELPVPHCPT